MIKIHTLAEFSDARNIKSGKAPIVKDVPLYETKRLTNRGVERVANKRVIEINIPQTQPYRGPNPKLAAAKFIAVPLLAGGAAYLVDKALGNPTRRLIKRIKHGKGRVKAHTRKGKLVKSHKRKK